LLGDPCDRAATAPLMVTATTAAIEKDKADYLEELTRQHKLLDEACLAGPFGPDDFGQWSRARSSR
jgi:hypothetical protein